MPNEEKSPEFLKDREESRKRVELKLKKEAERLEIKERKKQDLYEEKIKNHLKPLKTPKNKNNVIEIDFKKEMTNLINLTEESKLKFGKIIDVYSIENNVSPWNYLESPEGIFKIEILEDIFQDIKKVKKWKEQFNLFIVWSYTNQVPFKDMVQAVEEAAIVI